MAVLHTSRLRLEPFAAAHLDGLHDMNRRPEVMRYLSGQPETREQTEAGIARVQRQWAAWGTSWCFGELQARELLAVRHADNTASARVMDGLGMRYRGLESWYGQTLATHALGHEDWRRGGRQGAVR